MCQVHKGVKKLYDIGVLEDENKYEPELDDDWESFYISTLIDGSKIDSVSQDWFEVLRGEWGSENFKLDSGADINVLSFKRFVQLGNNPNNIVVNHKVKLQSYSGDFIPIKGICNIKWWYKNVQYDLKFAIADIDCQSVLGLQACLLLGLIKRIHDINFSKSNGKSERSVQTIKKMLKKSIDSRTDFYLNLLSYNNTPRENLNSPAQLLITSSVL
uniref:Peptidase A2 domain-containing protein n=1 Tax=Bombyx mori TaxID=7091 RepID=A0A8R2R1C7_BOMMO|nr:uncharacterized protein LOC119629728 [Bombyx mori]